MIKNLSAQLGHFRKGQKYFCTQNSLSYSDDVKPIIYKNRLNYLGSVHKYMHMNLLSLCVYYNLYGRASLWLQHDETEKKGGRERKKD